MNVYADVSAFKPLLPKAKATIQTYLNCNLCNPSAIYSRGRETRRLIENAREKVAKAIGADSEEIYFTSGSSEGINWLCQDRNVTATAIEHKAIMQNATSFIPVETTGEVDLSIFNQECPYYGYVAIAWINNEIGVIQPIKEIVDIAHKNHSRLLVDATQAIGRIPIDVHALDIDFLVGSFGKIGGLSGSGFMYAKKSAKLSPFIKGGGQERGMRASTENVLGIIVGGEAIESITQNIESKASIVQQKRDRIISALLSIPKSHLNGSLDNRACNNINIAFEGIEAESLVLQCDLRGVCISTGSACNSASIEPSYVLKAIGLSDELAKASIRITIDETITDNQINYLIETIKECVQRLRQASPQWKQIKALDKSK